MGGARACSEWLLCAVSSSVNGFALLMTCGARGMHAVNGWLLCAAGETANGNLICVNGFCLL